MEGDTISHSCHSQFTHTEVQVAAGIVILGEIACILHVCLVGRSKVSTAAKQVRQEIFQAVNHRTGQSTGSLCLVFISPEIFVLKESFRINRSMELIPFSLEFREFSAVVSKELIPSFFCLSALLGFFFIMGINILRNVEGLFWFRPAQIFLEGLDIINAERFAMCAGFTLFCRAAVTNLRLNRDEGRMFFVSLGRFNSFANSFQIIAIFYSQRLETESLHTFFHIFREGNIRAAFDGNLIGIIKHNQFGEAERTSQREGFRRNAFHHAAIAAQSKGIMVNHIIARLVEFCSQMSFCHRHTYSHTHACPQRAGRGFNTYRVTIFRMPRSQRTVLTEVLHIIHGKAITEEMEQRIKQRRTMTTGQDETVAVSPLRILRVVVHVVSPQFISHSSAAKGQAGMTGICLLYSISCQNADSVYTSGIHVTQCVSLLT